LINNELTNYYNLKIKLYLAINYYSKLKIMKNYYTYTLCLLLAFSFVACEETTKSDTQTVENQVVTTENEITNEPQTVIQTFTDEGDVAESQADIVEQIRADYGATMAKITKESLKKLTKEFSCEDDAEGTLNRYYNGDELEMLEYTLGYEHGWESQTIYFKNGQPYFIFEEEGSWHFGGPEGTTEAGENTIDDISETRYYIQSGKVIRKLNKKYQIKSWETKPKVNEIPNKTITEGLGKTYPKADAIPKLSKGNVAC
jgi:hypothetical protein